MKRHCVYSVDTSFLSSFPKDLSKVTLLASSIVILGLPGALISSTLHLSLCPEPELHLPEAVEEPRSWLGHDVQLQTQLSAPNFPKLLPDTDPWTQLLLLSKFTDPCLPRIIFHDLSSKIFISAS